MTRRRWILLVAIVAGILIPIAIVAAARIPFSSETLRKRLVTALEERLEADVSLETLTLRFQPRFHAVGTGLAIRHKRRHDVPPLISIATFTIDSDLLELWRRQVAYVKLDGLKIQVPPNDPDQASVSDMAASALTSNPSAPSATGDYVKQVVIRDLDAPDAELVVLRREPDKPPRTWRMHQLHLKSVGIDRNMPFETVLTNAVPPGEIRAKGSFGPWQRDVPGQSPLDGVFTFQDADLGVFKGIGGTLSAEGDFKGTLERIDINGRTETPDFMIDTGQHPMRLSTSYHAIVDATNGNTTLDPVDAKFLDTSITARGGVYEVEGVKGRVVRLDLTMENGRLDDIMRLAVPTPRPPMSGRLHLTTKFVLPPGDRSVVDKLQLDGRFAIEGGRFTDATVQKKINELSRRASARATEPPARTSVGSGFAGRFALNNGRMTVPTVTFDVPGALVELSGHYGMKREDIAFNGRLFMDAKISQTVTGFKSLLLKVVDPLFRRDGKTVVPIRISGTRNNPQFGVNVRQVFSRSDKRPTPQPPRRSPEKR